MTLLAQKVTRFRFTNDTSMNHAFLGFTITNHPIIHQKFDIYTWSFGLAIYYYLFVFANIIYTTFVNGKSISMGTNKIAYTITEYICDASTATIETVVFIIAPISFAFSPTVIKIIETLVAINKHSSIGNNFINDKDTCNKYYVFETIITYNKQIKY